MNGFFSSASFRCPHDSFSVLAITENEMSRRKLWHHTHTLKISSCETLSSVAHSKLKCVSDDWFFGLFFFFPLFLRFVCFQFMDHFSNRHLAKDGDRLSSKSFSAEKKATTCYSISNKSSRPYLIEHILIKYHITVEWNVSTADYIDETKKIVDDNKNHYQPLKCV